MNKLIFNLLAFLKTNSRRIRREKEQIRLSMHDLKKMLSEDQKQKEAEVVFRKIELLPEFKTANSILIYWSTSGELPTHNIVKIWSQDKLIILPSVHNDQMVLNRYTSQEKLIQKALDIWEPNLTQPYKGKVDLAIVPGIAFDKNKNRLGRGKGFYDRFLKKNNLYKIGVGFDCQLCNSFLTKKTDMRMDKIITPSNTIE